MVLRRSDTCDSTDTIYTGDISEIRKIGHEGIIRHQICRTCPQFCHVDSVNVTKVIDSSQNSQGLRSEQNSWMAFAHLKAQPAEALVGFVRCQGGRMGTWIPVFTCSRCYGFKESHLPSGHLICLAVTSAGCSTERSKQKTPAWGNAFFLIHKEKKLMSKKISHTTKNLFN